MFMMLEWLCIPLETGLWHSRNIKSDLKRMNPGYIILFLSTGVPPPFARWWKSASNHNGSDSYVKYLFSCHIGSVDKNNFRYCHGGVPKFKSQQKNLGNERFRTRSNFSKNFNKKYSKTKKLYFFHENQKKSTFFLDICHGWAGVL